MKKKFLIILLIFITNILYLIIWKMVDIRIHQMNILHLMVNKISYKDIFSWFIIAMKEEIKYRWIPIFFTVLITEKIKNKTVKYLTLWLSILISSILFGYGHGSVANIFQQGVSGIFLSFIFLITQERDDKLMLFPLMSCVIYHTAIDVLSILISLVVIKK